MSEIVFNTHLLPVSQGQDVVHLQSALASENAFQGDIDGSFGPKSAAALQVFQSARRLKPTGTLTPETAAALKWTPWQPPAPLLPEITVDLVQHLFPEAPAANIQANLSPVINALGAQKLADHSMLLMALATIRVETCLFLPVSERASGFNSSPGGTPFDKYDHHPGLGNHGAPDGALYRGRGFVQLTGRINYQKFGALLGVDLVTNPFLAHESTVAARLLAAFLKARESRIRAALAAGNVAEARRLVNGGSNGLSDFIAVYQQGLALLPGGATMRE